MVETGGPRAWVLPGHLYERGSGGVPRHVLYGYEEVVEVLARKYACFSGYESPFNSVGKRVKDMRRHRLAFRWPWTDRRYYRHIPPRVHPLENKWCDNVICATYDVFVPWADEVGYVRGADYGSYYEPTMWWAILSHFFFRRTCLAMGAALDYTDWTPWGLLRRCARDPDSWSGCSARRMGTSRVFRSLYNHRGDPFTVAWACAPARSLHPVYGMHRPRGGKIERRRGRFPSTTWLDSPASACHDCGLDAASAAGLPGVAWG